MDLVTLSVFRTVAREEGVTRAAQVLGRAPSYVTTRIQQLEAELGTPLFDRQRKRMILSQNGQTFLGYAERILNLADEAHQRLDPSCPSGTLRIGAMESTIAARLCAPLARFNRTFPQVTLDLTSAPSGALMDAVMACRLECALVAFPPDGDRPDTTTLERMALFREDLVLLVPSAHPPAQTAADLHIRTLAAFAPGCTYRALAADWLMAGSDDPLPFRVQEVASYHAMYACTAAGACISIMPESVAALVQHPGAVRALPLMEAVTHLVWRTGFDTAAFGAFRACLVEDANLT